MLLLKINHYLKSINNLNFDVFRGSQALLK